MASWATGAHARCRHNEGYWTSADWWGIGPGAHSHVGGTRWSNVRRPQAYAKRIAAGDSPAAGCEVLTPRQRAVEHVLLGLRRIEGVGLDALGPDGRAAVPAQARAGHVDPGALREGRVTLTRTGRLLADRVALALLD